ncbi:MAG: hypothetical protein IT559_05180 [Alphaproteobacteria bacterium]|nr:hypothetical protein [Alphaproteobacteria bacterium]
MYASTRNTSSPAALSFNIIENFADLTPKRKMSLCDNLFNGERGAFEGTIRILWPQATGADAHKLEKFLMLLQKSAR